jgi:PHS family inorganic phosphate transporter-like MFS transporter
VFGQLLFGYVGDWLGRNKAMFLTNFFCVLGAAGSAIFTSGRDVQLYMSIVFWRFLLGMGVGGVYPLSATSAAESTSGGNNAVVNSATLLARRTRVSWAFFWQVPGSTLPFFVAFLLAKWFPDDVDTQWRLTLGLGAIPAAAVMFHSLSQEESQEFRNAKQGSFDVDFELFYKFFFGGIAILSNAI